MGIAVLPNNSIAKLTGRRSADLITFSVNLGNLGDPAPISSLNLAVFRAVHL